MTDNKLLKQKWDRYHTELQQLLNELDIIGVMPGAPDDEYDGLNGRILGLLMDGASKTKIVEVIAHEAYEYYGSAVPKDTIEEFVDRVLVWWKQTKD